MYTILGTGWNRSLKTKIAASFGLVALHDRNFHAAALKFLDCHAEIGASYSEVLHAEDIALYGGICALASFTRQELREKVRSGAACAASTAVCPPNPLMLSTSGRLMCVADVVSS